MPTNIVIPTIGESVNSGVVSSWLKKDGDSVNRDEPVMELETDKVTMEILAPSGGVLRTIAAAGQEVKVGDVVGRVDEGAGASSGQGTPKASSSVPPPAAPASGAPQSPAAKKPSDMLGVKPAPVVPASEDVRATPLAKKVADEHRVDLSKVSGTGASGRIREQDVLKFVQGGSPAAGAAAVTGGTGAASGGKRRERMTKLRQRIAERLVEAQHTAAMLTTFNEVDMTAVMDLRKKYKDDFEKRHGVGLGFMSFFVAAAVNALKSFPTVNAFIVNGESGPEVEFHDSCDIAIAVGTEKGLVVPVLRGAERMSMAQVESGVKALAEKARLGTLTLEDMSGGTFTITNGGIYGSLMSTPILNPPQSAILGMHAIKTRAVEHPQRAGEVALRPMMYLALSYDHRLIDGSEAVRFLVAIKNAIEAPERLLLAL